jgi:uracil-DNA glycosylase
MAGFLPVPVDLVGLLPKSWHEVSDLSSLSKISKLLPKNFIPTDKKIFAAFIKDPRTIKVLIVGQDPYPNPDYANGLAFSVLPSITKLPASLKNIFKELENDLGILRINGDLSDWADQGVLLINRSLTVEPGNSGSHSALGWQVFTESVIKFCASNGALGILWGNDAQKLSHYFNKDDLFESAHPSPLSAYRGFFGSKPFSKVNARLKEKKLEPIKW